MKNRLTILILTLFLFPLFSDFYNSVSAKNDVRKKYNFNYNWVYNIGDSKDAQMSNYDDSQWEKVDLPRAFNEDEAFRLPIHELTDTIVWYRKKFRIPRNTLSEKVFIEFEGFRQAAEVYINGQLIGINENGIMASGYDLTDYIDFNNENVLAVKVDNSWDYREKSTNSKYQWNDKNFNANYGGITKNTFLHTTGKIYQTLPLFNNLGTCGVYVYCSDFDIPTKEGVINVESEIKNETDKTQHIVLQTDVFDNDNKLIGSFKSNEKSVLPGEICIIKASEKFNNLHFWSWGYGYLYDVRTKIICDNKVVDEVNTKTGFRKTNFGEGKVWLNDRVIQLKGYAQRTSNEWPAVGASIPAWLSDYSNNLMVESNGNLVRWMHIAPWKQDIESCDRVGLIQAMPEIGRAHV